MLQSVHDFVVKLDAIFIAQIRIVNSSMESKDLNHLNTLLAVLNYMMFMKKVQ